jgi:16S rRNA (guanine527-N7)-methyltransferase
LEALLPNVRIAFDAYAEFLRKSNERLNLTAVPDAETYSRHFEDSLALLRFADFKGKRVIDIGSGAGFPGVPLKLAEPSIALTLVDASRKRVEFLRELAALLRIDATILHARAEELALPVGRVQRDAAPTLDFATDGLSGQRDAAPTFGAVSYGENLSSNAPDSSLPKPDSCREHYDIAVSRAVARMSVLAELCLPFVQVGGLLLALKGSNADAELADADALIESLGGSVQSCERYERGAVVVVRKLRPTDSRYPRTWKQISRGSREGTI